MREVQSGCFIPDFYATHLLLLLHEISDCPARLRKILCANPVGGAGEQSYPLPLRIAGACTPWAIKTLRLGYSAMFPTALMAEQLSACMHNRQVLVSLLLSKQGNAEISDFTYCSILS